MDILRGGRDFSTWIASASAALKLADVKLACLVVPQFLQDI